MMNSSMKETFLEAIDHLLSIIDKYNIKNIGPQVDELQKELFEKIGPLYTSWYEREHS